MKTCIKCKLSLELSEFSKNSAKKDGLQNTCRDCRKAYQKTWYKENATVHKQRVYSSRNQVKQWVYDYLASHPCVDCGESRIPCLDFDHRDPSEKSFNLGGLGTAVNGLDRVKAEIVKCDVRCSNCHRVRTAEQFGWYAFTMQDGGGSSMLGS
jgi:hypothetical protein